MSSSDSCELAPSSVATSQISKLSASPDPSIDGLSTVLIVGGGCCGLLAGVALSGICDVHIYEQRDEILASESGDIGYLVTEELDQFLKQHKVPLENKYVHSAGRQVLADDGDVQLQDSREQEFISWLALHSALLEVFPKENYHPNSRVVAVDSSHPDVVVIDLENGDRIAGHVLVGADGAASCVRQQLLPSCQPEYAGYLAWRGVAQMDRLSQEVLHHLAGKATIYKGPNLHMQVHPVTLAGADSSASLAWTWFNNQADEERAGLLLDMDLNVCSHAVAVGRLSPAVADAVAAAAAEALPAPLAELISCSTKCMGVASVSDMALPCQSVGRVAFIGEAGCVARPHGSNALDKALADATSLTESMRSVKFTVERALPLWSLHQVQQSVALCKAAAAAGNRLQGTVEC